MSVDRTTSSLMQGFRALDLTDEQGLFCGRVLADLGVDVIKVEKPGGDAARKIGPFYRDTPDPEKSLFWFALNAGKRGITLDIETPEGKEILRQLVRQVDFVIESYPPGYLNSLGLGYAQLSEINPRLIVTSITPFGQSGPYRDYRGSDLVLMSLGGYVYLNGDADRPPVRISYPQSYYHSGSEAAAGTMIAHYHREATGEGQHVDVSIQESIVCLLLDAHVLWNATQWNVTRMGTKRIRPTGAMLQTCWPCKDGHIGFFLFGGAGGGASLHRLIEWIASDGLDTEGIEKIDWVAFDWSAPDKELCDRAQRVIGEFYARHTKAELYDGAIERKVWLFPVATVKDICESPQLAARGFWQDIPHPELDATIRYPGSFVKGSVPEVKIQGRAPLIGEHNGEVYGELMGSSIEEQTRLRQEGVI